jgi:dTMP kinase
VRVRIHARQNMGGVTRRHSTPGRTSEASLGVTPLIVDGRYRAAVARGRLITIEGLDGAGKSTLAAALAEALAERGIRVELLREPGGVALSERIRELVKDPALEIGARAEALLYAAARAELVHVRVAPLLDAGTVVLLDRFVDSSLAYQGAGRELGVREVRAVNLFATGDLTPDRTLLLRVSPRTGRDRQGARDTTPDRLERESERFFETIAGAYEQLAAAEPARIRTIDAEQAPARVREQALAAIEDLLPTPGA